jgi:hypothetical protein
MLSGHGTGVGEPPRSIKRLVLCLGAGVQIFPSRDEPKKRHISNFAGARGVPQQSTVQELADKRNDVRDAINA